MNRITDIITISNGEVVLQGTKRELYKLGLSKRNMYQIVRGFCVKGWSLSNEQPTDSVDNHYGCAGNNLSYMPPQYEYTHEGKLYKGSSGEIARATGISPYKIKKYGHASTNS